MSEKLQLKAISSDAIQRAIEKAERYRLLNDPEQAESICLDVLATEPDNQATLRILVLALTDLFVSSDRHGLQREARDQVEKLRDPYERAYFTGIVFERHIRAYLHHRGVPSDAYQGFREAMHWYEKAEALRPIGNDDALLRWNSCVRSIGRHQLEPASDERELPLE